MDLTDSDDDATWTPFKKKGEAKGYGEEEDEEEEEEDEEDEEYRRELARKQALLQTGLPPPTRVVAEGAEFRVGDFMVLRSDAENMSSPIWRMDSKKLLQRFNSAQGSQSQWLYRSANLFTNYAPTQR